ncbi:MAG: DUF7017 domain-containing protein [Bacteroidales bacterium]
MSFEEVAALRKTDPEAAYAMAKDELALKPGSEEAKLALAWVLYDRLKNATDPERLDDFVGILHEISALQLDEEGKMINNQLCWLIGKIVFDYTKNAEFNSEDLEPLLDVTMTLDFTRPSKAYSIMFKAFNKAFKETPAYIRLVDWWGLENFLHEDFGKATFGDRVEKRPIAEQAYLNYSGQLTELADASSGEELEEIRDKIVDFLPRIGEIVRTKPAFKYLPPQIRLLVSMLGEGDDALDRVIPFVRQRQSEYWIWDAIANLFPDDTETRLAFLSKAVQCKARDTKLIPTRIRLVETLLEAGYQAEAKTEIERIDKICEEYGLNTPTKLDQWVGEEWYSSQSTGGNSMGLYRRYANQADEIIFGDVPEDLVVVENVNDEKRTLNFLKTDRTQGFFNYSRFLKRVKVGDILRLRMQETHQEGRYNIFTLQKVDEEFLEGILQPFEGSVTNPMDKSFGFVNSMFIPPDVYVMNNLRHGDYVSGKAIVSYNKKKDEWGWKVIALIKNW